MFMDTNVLVNSRIAQAPHHEIASNESLRISQQVVREYLTVMTRPQTWSVAIMLESGPVVTETLVALCRAIPIRGKQVHDANIVATMRQHGRAGF